MLAHGLSIGQVLGPIHDGDQRANGGAVDGHVCIDASGMAIDGIDRQLGDLGDHGGTMDGNECPAQTLTKQVNEVENPEASGDNWGRGGWDPLEQGALGTTTLRRRVLFGGVA